MSTVPTYRSGGAGGKIVNNRRKQRLSATPYDRPLPPPRPHRSPNWFTGVVIPSARAIASGAGKILSSVIFSDSESSSSEDEDYASEDENGNVNEYEDACDGINTLNENNVSSSERMQRGHDSISSPQRTETKRVIEQLIRQETFSREECDRLKKVLDSRVLDGSVGAGEKRSLTTSVGNIIDHEDVDIFNKAIVEAKKWFQQKKVGSSSVSKLAHGTCNLNSNDKDHVESEVGSPVDVARSYMRERPPWASPTKDVELRTPLAATTKLFKEGTSFPLSYDSLSSKRRNSLASGPWNIQEELRRVRSKATENMLHTPPSKINPSLLAVAPARRESSGAGKMLSAMGERTEKTDALMDVGVSSDPALIALELRQDGKASEAPSSIAAASVSRNNEESIAIHVDGERAPSNFPQPTCTNHAGEHHSDPNSSKVNEPAATKVADVEGRQLENGISSSQASLSAGVATVQNDKQYDEEVHNEPVENEKKSTSITNVEGKGELLSEAYLEIPVVTETDSIASGVQYEELEMVMDQPPTKGKADKPQGRKPSTRRSRGRGK